MPEGFGGARSDAASARDRGWRERELREDQCGEESASEREWRSVRERARKREMKSETSRSKSCSRSRSKGESDEGGIIFVV